MGAMDWIRSNTKVIAVLIILGLAMPFVLAALGSRIF